MANSTIKSPPRINGKAVVGNVTSKGVDIGTEEKSPSSVTSSIATGTTRKFLNELTLSKGIWLVNYRAAFRTASATGSRHLAICNSDGVAIGWAEVTSGSNSSGQPQLNVFKVVDATSDNYKIKAGVWQTSGTNMNVEVYAHAIKV